MNHAKKPVTTAMQTVSTMRRMSFVVICASPLMGQDHCTTRARRCPQRPFSRRRRYATLVVMADQNGDISLKFGYWFAVHRDQLRTWWAISIIAVDVLLLAVFAVSF